ncbi:MAG: elongation factor G [Syntrophales bacterium]|jgi:elongation factor G|nr:elongation factor G [Syntrophales bacterium]MCK9527586.1 elongation factor G [Syntrophales bacterium]MDX9922203.1 elongation factor G [Syntrophales bacterium]
MAKYDSNSLRNIAIIGHGGTGKTSLCESFLFVSGKTDKLGRVDDGTSTLDYEPEEHKRKISISSAVNNVDWNKHRINFVDTPGDANFAMDTRNCLRAVDSAVVVVDSVGGVEFQTEKVWEYSELLKLPRIVYVSKLDRERADFQGALDSVRSRLEKKVTPLFLPLGQEESFRGLIDLMEMKVLTFDEAKGTMKREDIPDDLAETAAAARESLVEDIAECDESLMDKYLEEGTLSIQELRQGLRKGVMARDIVPGTCGCSLKNIGAATLMTMLTEYFPSPPDRGALTGTHPKTGEETTREPDPSAPFSAMVFKTIADPYAGKLTIFRVFSGTLRADSMFYNSTKSITEKCGALFSLEGKTQKPMESVIPGDIAAMAKLKETSTGDTLCDEKDPVLYEKAASANPVCSYAIHPKAKGDEEKLFSSLNRLIEEDATLNIRRDEQTREMILSGMGQVHIDVTLEKMKRKFGVDVTLKQPKVPYKETIKGKARVQGKYKKQSGGRGQFGDTWLEIEPTERSVGFDFVDAIVGGVIPKNYIPAVEKGIVEAMAEGIIAGYPVVDVKVTLVDGSYHTVDSSEMAFKIAGSMGFKKGFEQSQPTLLEPIMAINIEVPDEYMGDVIGDLNSRRGRVLGMDKQGPNQVVKGQVPYAEILTYSAELTSITSGRGIFTFELSHYEEVPAHLQEKIIAEAKKEKEE